MEICNAWAIEEYWKDKLGSKVLEEIRHADHSASYEMDEAHVYKLENGQYALVTESGCSCYSSSDAVIDLYPDEATAVEQFDKWEKEILKYRG